MDVKNVLAVYKQGPDAVISLVLRMSNRIQSLETRVQELEYRTKKNSKNSHKPPSSDGLKKLDDSEEKEPKLLINQQKKRPITCCYQRYTS